MLVIINPQQHIIESLIMKNYILKLLAIFCFIFCFIETVYAKSEVNVYSYRQPILIDPFFDEFTKTTGIKVNVLHAKKGLLERVISEGANTPADLVLTVDIARLSQFVQNDLLMEVSSDILNKNIPHILETVIINGFHFQREQEY